MTEFRDLVNIIRRTTGAALVAYNRTEGFFRSASGRIMRVLLVESERVVLAINEDTDTTVTFTDTPHWIIASTAKALITG